MCVVRNKSPRWDLTTVMAVSVLGDYIQQAGRSAAIRDPLANIRIHLSVIFVPNQ